MDYYDWLRRQRGKKAKSFYNYYRTLIGASVPVPNFAAALLEGKGRKSGKKREPRYEYLRRLIAPSVPGYDLVQEILERKGRKREKKPDPLLKYLQTVAGKSALARYITRVMLWPISRAVLGPEREKKPDPLLKYLQTVAGKSALARNVTRVMLWPIARAVLAPEEAALPSLQELIEAEEDPYLMPEPEVVARTLPEPEMLEREGPEPAITEDEDVRALQAALAAEEAAAKTREAERRALQRLIEAEEDRYLMPEPGISGRTLPEPEALEQERAAEEELARQVRQQQIEEEVRRIQAELAAELAAARAREAERQALQQLIEAEEDPYLMPEPEVVEQEKTKWKMSEPATAEGISPEEQERRQIEDARAKAAQRRMSWGMQVELERRAQEAARRKLEELATARWNSLSERAKQYVNMIADRQLDEDTLSRVWRSRHFQEAIKYLGITDLRPYIKKSAAPPAQEAEKKIKKSAAPPAEEAEKKRSAGMGRSQLAEVLVSPDVVALRDRLFALTHVDKDALLSYLRGRVQRGDMPAEDANWLVAQLEAENVRRRRLNRAGQASRRAWRDVARIAENIPERPRVPNPMRTFVSLYNRLAYPQEAALREAAAAQSALMQQEMISRGLSNTSVLAGAQRGIQSALGRDISLMRAQTAQTAAALTPGLMPPILLPDYSELQNMAYLAGYGSLRRRRSLAAALQ